MQISSETMGNVRVVRFEGSLDTNASPEAQDYLDREIDEGATIVVVNLGKVDFVSSTGLRVLWVTAKRLGGSGGSLRICGLNETVSEVFEISGFSTILNVFSSEADAVSDS